MVRSSCCRQWPRQSPGETRRRAASVLGPASEGTGKGRKRVEKSRGQGEAQRGIRRSSPVPTPGKEPDKEGNIWRKARPKRRGRTRPQRHLPPGSLQTLTTGSVFPLGPTGRFS